MTNQAETLLPAQWAWICILDLHTVWAHWVPQAGSRPGPHPGCG